MKKLFLLLAFLFLPAIAHAQNCGAYPYTLFNGTVADATQVQSNFNFILSCANNNLAHNGANSDITSLSGLTTPLPVNEGGTGNTTGAPSGPAGGVLSGTYPNPSFANCGADTIIANLTAGSAPPVCNAIATVTTNLIPCVGDTGSGGTAGIVPAPPAGSGALHETLDASTCGWSQTQALSAGMIMMYGAATAPAGWFVCNGQAVSRTTYAALFAVIGTTFGIGDGATTFNVPNMMGYFPRGYDTSGLVDPGRSFGSKQTDQMQGHYHGLLPGQVSYWGRAASGGTQGAPSGTGAEETTTTGSPVTDGVNGAPRVGAETRPVNVALTFIIKQDLTLCLLFFCFAPLRPANDNESLHRKAA